MSLLAERLLAVHRTLAGGGVPHAFGGAIALAYCTNEPRGTRDLDVNVFVDPAGAGEVFALLPDGVRVRPADRRAVARDGQVRLWWDDTPVDLFFDVHDFHRQARYGVRHVPFADQLIPVLGCTELVVFKAMFNRTKDWADIEEMVHAGTVDDREALRWLAELLGADDPVTVRLAALF